MTLKYNPLVKLGLDDSGGGGGAASITVGTTVLTGGTTGSVLFVGSSSVLQQDNANFFWNYSTKSFGIGTNSPSNDASIEMYRETGWAAYATTAGSGKGFFSTSYNGPSADFRSDVGTCMQIFATSGIGALIQRFNNATGSSTKYLLYVNQDSTSDAQDVCRIKGDGTGLLLNILDDTNPVLQIADGGVSTFTGAIALSENTYIALDPAGSADGKFTGITVSGTAGTALAFGDLVYLAAADSRWELADADAASTSGDVMLGMCVLAAAGDGSATNILLHGIIRADAAFPTLTVSAQVYVSTTPGDIQVAQPSGTDDVIRVVGRALTADEIYFNPSEDYVTHT